LVEILAQNGPSRSSLTRAVVDGLGTCRSFSKGYYERIFQRRPDRADRIEMFIGGVNAEQVEQDFLISLITETANEERVN
jgi:hypothetical protein